MDINQMEKDIAVIVKWMKENRGIPKEVHDALLKDLNRRYAWIDRLKRMPKKRGS